MVLKTISPGCWVRASLMIFFTFVLKGTPCDLVTGEERIFQKGDQDPASHVSCTVEMLSVHTPCKYPCCIQVQQSDPFKFSKTTNVLALDMLSRLGNLVLNNCCSIVFTIYPTITLLPSPQEGKGIVIRYVCPG